MNQREQIIKNYIEAYNHFNVDKMVENFDASVIFENISNNTVNLSLKGLNEFKTQAEQAKSLFSERKQIIRSFAHR